MSYSTDDEDELGALIYNSSRTAKARASAKKEESATHANGKCDGSVNQNPCHESEGGVTVSKDTDFGGQDDAPQESSVPKKTMIHVAEYNRTAPKIQMDCVICSVTGCINRPIKGGTCIMHGGGGNHNECSHNGCMEKSQTESVCDAHGVTCNDEECTIFAQKGGVCIKHAAKVTRKTCSHEGCTNNVKNIKEDACWRHGENRCICSHRGCIGQVVDRGACRKHGVTGARRICSHEGCTNKVVNSGVCIRHGAKSCRKLYICRQEGCTNQVVNRGVCIRHGAKRSIRKKKVLDLKS